MLVPCQLKTGASIAIFVVEAALELVGIAGRGRGRRPSGRTTPGIGTIGSQPVSSAIRRLADEPAHDIVRELIPVVFCLEADGGWHGQESRDIAGALPLVALDEGRRREHPSRPQPQLTISDSTQACSSGRT